MKLAIMQPYFFPYIGYWQLIRAADRFVIYDDVNYIKGGWINRNRILINGEPSYITVPLHQSSPYKRIFGKPFALKGMILNYNIPFLDAIFEKAIFIQLRRDPVTQSAGQVSCYSSFMRSCFVMNP
jgi:hypothetical protein